MIIDNESSTTTINRIDISDGGAITHVINNLGPGLSDTITGLGTDVTATFRIGTSHPAGRIKFFDNTRSLVSCNNIPLNSNVGLTIDLDPMAASGSYRFKYNDVTCPN